MSAVLEPAGVEPADTLSPADRYGELFTAVQTQVVFADSKTFVDCAPRDDPRRIVETYRRERRGSAFDLPDFVAAHFDLPDAPAAGFTQVPGDTLDQHIARLWPVLTRTPAAHPKRSSLLPLPEPYVVPGGRFRELYYWDSYFTMLGLAVHGHAGLVRNMTDDFAHLIDVYGHVPNANRSYYISRSQPPVFSFMVRLAARLGVAEPVEFERQLQQEHSWWTAGADDLRPGEAHGHCVRMPDGALLNRYWDERDTPREEAYREDVATARRSGRPAHVVYRDLRAAAASGWDFSSRWCTTPDDLSTTKTTSIVPVDLNAFLYSLETLLAEIGDAAGDAADAEAFRGRAERRRVAMDTWLWDDEDGAYLDWDIDDDARRRQSLTTACVTPLWVGAADGERAARTAQTMRDRLLRPGGIGTTEHETGQQWDKPNGWAPLQWMAIRGLGRYGSDLAGTIRERWLRSVTAVFDREHKLVEKYAMLHSAEHSTGGGGGEYPLQDGFGWTNGVTAALLRTPASAR